MLLVASLKVRNCLPQALGSLGAKQDSQLASIGVVFGVRKDNGSLYVQQLLPGGSAERSQAIQVNDELLVSGIRAARGQGLAWNRALTCR